MDSSARNRARLWLRSEKLFGLPQVAVPPVFEVSATDESYDAPEPLPSPPVAVERSRATAAAVPPPAPVTAARTVVVNLFGADTPKPAAKLAPPAASAPPFDAPPLSTEEKRARLLALDNNEVRGCTKCRLCETRANTVFGEGDADAEVFFIGEGPGENEDLSGRPFVGRAGELLNKWIAAMGLRREQVFIANIVKCRPPDNRVPAPDEVATCTPYLQRQLEIVRPRVIMTLGLPSAKYMLQLNLSMGKMRGNWYDWRGIKLMPTYHPAYVLRQYTVETRSAVWSDLKKVMTELGLTIPSKS
jgi:uracil-DNA glycosylase family 4